jgi:hypothetical protein
MVVVAVIAIIAAIALPNVLTAMEKGRHTSAYTNMKVLDGGLQAYMLDQNGPPTTLNVRTLAPLYPQYLNAGQRTAILSSLETGRLLYFWSWSYGGWWDYDYILGFRPKRDDPAVWCYLYPEGIWRWDTDTGWAQVM